MADVGRIATERHAGVRESWRRLNFEQRLAAVAALLLIGSTFGSFSFVEAALVLTAGGVLALLKQRADRKPFHLPFGDGTVIFVAGLWSALLIVVRLFDKPLGQSVLALACAAVLAVAGAREKAKRPPDDLPPLPPPRRPRRRPATAGGAGVGDLVNPQEPPEFPTARLSARDEPTERVARRSRADEPDRPDASSEPNRPRAPREPPPRGEDGTDAPPRPGERP